MTIVGFNFTKMLVEKNESSKGKINISNNVAISDVTEALLPFGSKNEKGIKFSFKFFSRYEPKIGEINFEGNVLFMESNKKVEEILDNWKKNKKIEKTLMKGVLNTILTKSNIQALILSKEINLPPPIPLPKIGEKKKAVSE